MEIVTGILSLIIIHLIMQKDIGHRVFIVHLRKLVRSFLLSMLNSIMVLILLGASSLLKVRLEMVVLVVASLLKNCLRMKMDFKVVGILSILWMYSTMVPHSTTTCTQPS